MAQHHTTPHRPLVTGFPLQGPGQSVVEVVLKLLKSIHSRVGLSQAKQGQTLHDHSLTFHLDQDIVVIGVASGSGVEKPFLNIFPEDIPVRFQAPPELVSKSP